uniref:Uncharacterized protein n=1 Tax=Asparagus officinalis TaxID=4686 RepID=Q2AA62_ASPOF|nr:hypothetical protein 18.t00009 [Asparagus officinalis]
MDKGYRVHAALWCSAFTCWQTNNELEVGWIAP